MAMFDLPSPIRVAAKNCASEYARVARRVARLNRRITHKPRYLAKQILFAGSGRAREIADGEDSFALYRIIGNDLPPRHQERQSLSNLRFQLDHERTFEACEKWWVVNRIFDKTSFDEIIDLLESRQCNYFIIPFDADAYRKIPLDCSFLPADPDERRIKVESLEEPMRLRAAVARVRLKNLYVMNNNSARNAALGHGRERAKWILPWDGNCFLTEEGWSQIVKGVHRKRHLPYHIVPMARAVDNDALLDNTFVAKPTQEPQIIAHRTSKVTFDERHPYGRRPKVDLLQRLNVWGPWMAWSPDPWDIKPLGPAEEEWLYSHSPGWVVRLSSGNPHQEHGHRASVARLNGRNEAIIETLTMLDERYDGNGFERHRSYYDLI